jgi:hypothetical protein
VTQDPARATSPHTHHTLVRLRVTGGFLGGIDLALADGLNCFIGGRGAGKTTALEFMRFALGLVPDARVGGPRNRALDSLVKANLGNGRIDIDLRTRAGMTYTARRTATDSVEVLGESGAALPINLDRDLIFSADVFSQNEIEEIASSPAAQLALLDRFEEGDTSEIEMKIADLRRQLEQSSADLTRLDREIDDRRSRAAELPGIEEKLKALIVTGGPNAERTNAAHAAKALRGREERVLGVAGRATQTCVTEISGAVASLRASINAEFDTALREGPNGELIGRMLASLRSFEDVATAAAAEVSRAAAVAQEALGDQGRALAAAHATQEAGYRELLALSAQEGGRAAERAQLQAAKTAAEGHRSEQLAREKIREDRAAERTSQLDQLSELRDRRYTLRKRVAQRICAQFPTLRVTVSQAAENDAYRELLTGALKGAGVKQGQVADRLVQAFLPGELATVIRHSDLPALAERAGLDPDRGGRVLAALREPGVAYSVECVDLEDRPVIELKDGAVYKSSGNLSTGQRCTTILPILLVQSERPLLIDQPEDNLDNAFIYETIVRALRDIRHSRQVIFVTHNPNIPVLGEAARVFVFDSDGQKSRVRQAGTVDECKDDIERILEGGRDAFIKRKDRYGH